MALIQISTLQTKFYNMTAQERIDALNEAAKVAIETDKQPYKPRAPEGDTLPKWVKDIIAALVDECKGKAMYDRVNNVWKIAVPDLKEDDFFTGWQVRVSKELTTDPEKQKWYNETPVQATSLVEVVEAALDSDDDLQELNDIR